MGQINDAIEAIEADDSTYPTRASKRQAKGQVKQQGWLTNLDNRLPYTLAIDASREVEFLDDYSFEIGQTPEGSCFVKCHVIFRRDGVPEFDGTWTVVNPPILVPDPTGEVDRGNGKVYRENLLDALRQICDQRFP